MTRVCCVCVCAYTVELESYIELLVSVVKPVIVKLADRATSIDDRRLVDKRHIHTQNIINTTTHYVCSA